ncbi:MAG TPA: O-antigen ligase family protein [Pirellulales bacterium]|nr:O-antigen ligase family protein [Pirellulales bacterium]
MSSVALTRSLARTQVCSSLGNQVGLALMSALILFNDATFRVADPDEVSRDWQTALRLGLCGLCGGYAILNLPQALRVLVRFPMAWLILFASWAAVTLPIAESPTYAAAAWLALVSSMLFAAALVARVPGESIVKALLATMLVFAIVCWIAQFTYPELGQPDYLAPGQQQIGWRLGGVTHPNGLGAHCALALGLLFVGRRTWQWSLNSVVPTAAFFGITLLCTGSRTSCLMLLVGGALLAVRRNAGLLTLAMAALSTMVFLGEAVGVDWSRLSSVFARENGLRELTTLTGRTDLWQMAWKFISESPFYGHGYGCSRFLFIGSADFPATHPHNQFLDTAIEIGLVGVTIEAAMFVALARRFWVRPSTFPDVVFALVAVMGLFEVPLFSPLPEVFTLSWMLALAWPRDDIGLSRNVRTRSLYNPESNLQNSPGVA